MSEFASPNVFQLDFSDVGRLDGRVSIVTGAGGGIGRAIAICFAQRGANVVCADVDLPAAQQSVDEIVSSGGQAFARECNVASPAQAAAVAEEAAQLPGGLRVLVNCAGIYGLSDEDWHVTIEVNLFGVINTCRTAIPWMRRAGGGSIVNVASQLGHVAVPGRAAYSASKAGVIQLSRSLAIDHAFDRIRVNSLSPGPVAVKRKIDEFGGIEQFDERVRAACPMGRAGRPAEIARAALFLACDDSSFVTGTDLLVDGGYVAQ